MSKDTVDYSEQPGEPQDITDKRMKAIDLLYDGMVFWHTEGIKIVNQIIRNLKNDGSGREAAALAKIWKGYDDRWIDIASKLAPYQSAKLSSINIKSEHVTKYVVEVPRKSKDSKEWLEQVEVDKKLLPPPVEIRSVVNDNDDTIDEIEFENIETIEN